MMSHFLFVLGRNPELALVELHSYFQAFNIPYKMIASSKKKGTAVLETEIDPSATIFRLGGTVKIAKHINQKDWEPGFFQSNVVYYAFTNYDHNDNASFLERFKEKAKQEKVKTILVHGKEWMGVEPSKFLRKNMLQEGFEFFQFDNQYYQTVAVSDTRTFEQRDIGRPYQEPLEAISIRLAKILINLARVKEKETLLDPFMGIGTILQEALLMNINAIGIDKDKQKVAHAKKNLSWFKHKYSLTSSFTCIEGDSASLPSFVQKYVDGIVTEPYLGPLLKRLPTKEEAKIVMKKLEETYYLVFKGIYGLLKKKGHIAIIVPQFRTREGARVIMDIKHMTEGFSLVSFPGFSLPLLYNARKSRILREIWILRKD